MITRSKKTRPQVPGGPSSCASSDESRLGSGTRGAYNLRATCSRQTTMACTTDSELQCEITSTPSSTFSQDPFSRSSPTLSSNSIPLEDVAQETINVTNTVPTTGAMNTRKKWTTEMNKFILRNYLHLTMMETDVKGYLPFLHAKFIENFPDMTTVSRQRVGDQRRAIVRKQLLPQQTIEEITREVQATIQHSYSNTHHLNTDNINIQNTQTMPLSQPGQRMRWTDEHNEAIIRSYYKITKLETDRTSYRKNLYQDFISIFPNLAHLSEQRVADQRRAIIENKYFTEERLNAIRQEVRSEIEPIDSFDEIRRRDEDYLNHMDVDVTTSQIQDETVINIPQLNMELSSKIDASFDHALVYYTDTLPTQRHYIPKQKSSRRLASIVHYINTQILPKLVNSDTDFNTFQTIIYCAAWTAAKINGAKINIPPVTETTNTVSRKIKPKWQIRLEQKIEKLRANIGRLLHYINGNRTANLTKHVEDILKNYKIHTSHEEKNTELSQFLDTLKQKLAVASSRLKRYKTCTLRKSQNNQFIKNEKQFYRKIRTTTSSHQENTTTPTPETEVLHRYWSQLWGSSIEHNDNADWIQEETTRASNIESMEFAHIPTDTFHDVIRKLHNWKTPGSDFIHNYWYKHFTNIHPFLYNYINDFILNPHTIPEYITAGITFMLPKDQSDGSNPAKYRPITCLQTIYKIITSCLAELIYKHVDNNSILAQEQRGCKKYSQGCKEQLTIDSVILKQVQKKKKDLFTMYIDYKKAYDSVPHSWLLKVLEIYKIHPSIRVFLHSTMTNWTTRLKVNSPSENVVSNVIQIKRGIFQGDALSPLWFCLSLNPLSNLLNKTNIGYPFLSQNPTTDTSNNTLDYYSLNHLLYMDDIKLYAVKQEDISTLAQITEFFSRDICMEFGIDKCRLNSVKAGQIHSHHYELQSGEQIKSLNEDETYKYLGYAQSKQINHKAIKSSLKVQFKHRLNSIAKSYLYSKNTTKAINTYAVPILTYSFGIIHWSKTELKTLQRLINLTLTKNRKHHPRSCVQRLTIPRKQGGRGLIDIVNLHNKQISNLRTYFHNKSPTSTLYKAIVLNDLKFTPLNLQSIGPQKNEKLTDIQTKLDEWARKSLHGRHYNDLNQQYVDKIASNEWLKRGELFPETEGFMLAIQDQVIETRNYQKHIMKIANTTDICRRCQAPIETIQHITGSCKAIVQTDYKHRHDQVANIIHQKMAIKHKLISLPSVPYYKYAPQTVLENSTHKLYFDRAILTDKTVHYNRPDITLIDKVNKTAQLIDIAVPNTHNLQITIAEKLSKYIDLKDEIARLWHLQKVTIIPIVISTTGVIPKQLHQSIATIQLPKLTYLNLQKAVILNTCRITRKFLQIDRPLTSTNNNS